MLVGSMRDLLLAAKDQGRETLVGYLWSKVY